MFNHIGVVVADFARSAALYDAFLAPLGIRRIETDLDWAIYGTHYGAPFIWVGSEVPSYWRPQHEAGRAPIHIALDAPDRAAVEAFYAAALEKGAEDNGPPGPRVSWANFFSAYIIDFDGNNIEATIREP